MRRIYIYIYMKYEKIFQIGFGKTGTISMHNMFLELGVKSQHSREWNLNEYESFFDGHTYRDGSGDFTKLYSKYENPLFILSTRSLGGWIFSLNKHINRQFMTWKKEKSFWPPSVEYNIKEINRRKNHYYDVLDFFKNDPSKLIVVSIDKPNWLSFVAESAGFSYEKDIRKNVLEENTLLPEHLKLIKDTLNETYTKYEMTENDIKSLHLDENLISLYKNNL